MKKKVKTDQELLDSLAGMGHLRRVAGLLSHLHEVGCTRDRAGNREFHFDDHVLLVLLYLFNPMIDSMRMLVRLAGLEGAREKLGIRRRVSLGSFSESCRVFEPAMLKGVVEQLYGQMLPVGREEMFRDIKGLVELVDGTTLDTLGSVTEAMWLSNGKRSWKLHLGFEVDRHIPTSFDLTDSRGKGLADERAVLGRRVEPGRTYVTDRGYAQFALFNRIHAAGSNYVCRVRDNSVYEVISDAPLAGEDVAAGVISDQIVRLGSNSGKSGEVDHPLRLICIKTTPHLRRGKGGGCSGGGQGGPASDGVLRIATDLLDPPAHVIGFLYEKRWTLEVFVRFLKQTLGCRHLISTRRQGIEIQIYAAVIACMLINITTGRKPDKWMVTLMGLHLAGVASEADVARELTRKDNTGVKLRAKAEELKKMGIIVR